MQLLNESEILSIDDINLKNGLSSGTVAVSILNLEMQNVIECLPGKMYRLT